MSVPFCTVKTVHSEYAVEVDLHKKNKPRLPKPSPPLLHTGSTPDSERAKKPRLTEPAQGEIAVAGDRVKGLGNLGKSTGDIGTVERANEDDAVIKWDDDGRMRVQQPWLTKI
jgi:hypothetical protein